ncbi:hypothetical protein [Blastopirellula marina]|uniref:Uncharacterized protein n=1 Tax=Blastopirellula marina TaxID=124 RepID=A0A2S8FH81_9BACT|nr:hypothetical protein [Blastopirellula marina]PQO31506.1 hypothetical protein C5Y98_18965 [Blastopirellula marina]PTL42812.1 hypothetical protein C5Y97_18975 [Blastopirellula marina]
MEACLLKFSDALIIRLARARGITGKTNQDWGHLLVEPEGVELDISLLKRCNWTVALSNSMDDFGKFMDIAKVLSRVNKAAEQKPSPASAVASFKRQEGQYFFKLTQQLADKLESQSPESVLLVANLLDAQESSGAEITDEEFQAALNRATTKYAKALQWLAE